jgi:hypothetical protein
MRSMQDKITGELEAAAAGLGLELVHAPGRASNTGTLYYQDGLDTPMAVAYNFQSDLFILTLTGPAVAATPAGARRELGAGVFRAQPAGSARAAATFHAENTDGARIRAALGYIKTALAPYAPKPATAQIIKPASTR